MFDNRSNLRFVYVLLNPLKPGIFKYDEYEFEFEPFYVGKTNRIDRLIEHLELFKSGRAQRFMNSILREIYLSNKEPIEVRILNDACPLVALVKEAELIEKIGRMVFNSGPLVNLQGGLGGRNAPLTDEQKLKNSLSHKGQPAWNKDLPKERQPMFGKAHSDFTKMKMSKPKANTENYKKPKSKEHAQRISEALKNANHPTKSCGICGKEFQPNNGKARFCLECQKISHYQRQKLLGNK